MKQALFTSQPGVDDPTAFVTVTEVGRSPVISKLKDVSAVSLPRSATTVYVPVPRLLVLNVVLKLPDELTDT
jgi:hypothetical protein